jgi:hypothetical protein
VKKLAFRVTLRHVATGKQHERTVFAENEANAKTAAIERARIALSTTMAERRYGRYDVVACERRS